MLIKRKPPEFRFRAAFFSTSNLLVDPIAIPDGQAPRLFPNRNVFLCSPSVPEPKLDHSGHNYHNNHQGDKIGNSNIELAEEGVQRKQEGR